MADRLTTADRVARRAIYGYATDVISAAVYAYVILPNRWRTLIRDARAQRQLERQTWEALADTRGRLARISVAIGIQRAFRRRQIQKSLMKERSSRQVIARSVWLWVIKQRTRREASTRRQVVQEWLHRTIIGVYITRSDHAQRIQRAWRHYRCLVALWMVHQRSVQLIQRQWRAHHTRQCQLMDVERRLAQVKMSFSREKIRAWARMILFRRAESREQDQERERKDKRHHIEQERRISNQAACWIQTRWRRHHQRLLRRQLMTVEAVPVGSEVEECNHGVDTTESDSVLHQELLQHTMRRRLERFLLVWIKKSRQNHSAKAQHQSHAAGRVINRCIRRYLQLLRQDSSYQGPESDEAADADADGNQRPVDEAVILADARIIGLSGRVPIRPPKPSERSSSSGSLSWESTNAATTLAAVPRHSQAESSSRHRDDTCSIKRSRITTSSSSWITTVTTRPTILPPVRVPQHATKPQPTARQHRLMRTKSEASGNQTAHNSSQYVRTLPAPRSEMTTRALPPLQKVASIAGTTRLLKTFEPQRDKLPRLGTTNQAAESESHNF